LWEVEKYELPKISPFEEADKLYLGTDGTYSLREMLTG
jgi:hypothetical protein